MENCTNTERLSDYKNLFDEFISGKDITKMSNDLKISKSTIYTYFNGGIPSGDNAIVTEGRILNYCKCLLLERGKILTNALK